MNDGDKVDRNDSSNHSMMNEKYYSNDKSEIWFSKPIEKAQGRAPSYSVLHFKPGRSYFARSSCDSAVSSFILFMKLNLLKIRQKYTNVEGILVL